MAMERISGDTWDSRWVWGGRAEADERPSATSRNRGKTAGESTDVHSMLTHQLAELMANEARQGTKAETRGDESKIPHPLGMYSCCARHSSVEYGYSTPERCGSGVFPFALPRRNMTFRSAENAYGESWLLHLHEMAEKLSR